MLAAGSKVAQDVPPYAMVAGDRARLVGVNAIGLERRGFSPENIAALQARPSARSSTPSCCAKKRFAQVLDEYGALPEVRAAGRFHPRLRARRRRAATVSRLGLIAGNGVFPLEVATAARRRGVEVVAVAHRGETNRALAELCDQITWIKSRRAANHDRRVQARRRRPGRDGGWDCARATGAIRSRPMRARWRCSPRWADSATTRCCARSRAKSKSEGIAMIDPVPMLDDAIAGPGRMAGTRAQRGAAQGPCARFRRDARASAVSISARPSRCATAWWARSRRSREPMRHCGARRRYAAAAWSSPRRPSPARTCASTAPRSARRRSNCLSEIGAAMIGIEAGRH